MKILLERYLLGQHKVDFLFILRIWLGFMLILHSYDTFLGNNVHEFAKYLSEKHHFPMPLLMAYLAKGCELLGGLLVVVGLLTRLGAVLIMLPLLVATFYAHRNSILGHGELALNYLLIALVIAINNPQKFSLDNYLKKYIKRDPNK